MVLSASVVLFSPTQNYGAIEFSPRLNLSEHFSDFCSRLQKIVKLPLSVPGKVALVCLLVLT